MEERVGEVWHRLVTRLARTERPEAVVTLAEMQRSCGVLYRALGGDAGRRIEAGTVRRHGARRSLVQRLAGVDERVDLCWRDGDSVRLPLRLGVFADRLLNRDLYLWLAALAAAPEPDQRSWWQRNQTMVAGVLAAYPGLRPRYARLVEAVIGQRPDLQRLPAAEAAVERALQAALREPGSVPDMPPARRPPAPVPLWLYAAPPRAEDAASAADAAEQSAGAGSRRGGDERRREAERVAAPQGRGGLLLSRFESLFSWAEYVNVDRATDEDDEDDAQRIAEDMQVLSLARDRAPATARLRFDLDLPAAAQDDAPLGPGIALPEWDYRSQRLLPEHCRVQLLAPRASGDGRLPPRLEATARRLRRQFERLAAAPRWRHGEAAGEELDIERCVRHGAERLHGRRDTDPGLYRARQRGERDFACLLLADLSLSTDAWVSNEARVIDVIRDALLLFAESLMATGDRFSIYGFSSRLRQQVRMHALKTFEEPYAAVVRARLAALRPGYYTRMGAAIRCAAQHLEREPASRRLLLLLTDGKPNDLDHYEGRYGVEDTRAAIAEARRKGLRPFCVTIDERAAGYLPRLFGTTGYAVIRDPLQLPAALPRCYASLMA